MVTILDMVSGKFLPQKRERSADSRQSKEWPADVRLPTPSVQPLPVSNPAERNKMPPDLASIPTDILEEK
jgi:hypothetical protein